MRILDNTQVSEELGKFSIFRIKPDLLLGTTQYLGGIPEVDELFESKNISPDFGIGIRPNGIQLYFLQLLSKKSIALHNEDITFWTIEQQTEEIQTSKSVLGRAVVGGLLLGPLGAVIGGVSGVGKKSQKLSDVENIIHIGYKQGTEDIVILLSCKDKNVKKVFNYFKKYIGNKYKKPNEVHFDEKNMNNNRENSVSDELIKMKKLLDEGVLTQQEFEKEKNKLLNS